MTPILNYMFLKFTDYVYRANSFFYKSFIVVGKKKTLEVEESVGKESFDLEDQTIWGEIIGWLRVVKNACFFD